MAAVGRCVGRCLSFSGRSNETPQILILGLEGAGKTTLLYRLKIPGWESSDKVPDGSVAVMKKLKEEKEDVNGNLVARDPGYHFEELSRPFTMGVWEIPGSKAMRHIWKSIYTMVKIHCVIFVIDAADSVVESMLTEADEVKDDNRTNEINAERAEINLQRSERIGAAKRYLNFLMNEDELRHSAFCVIINNRLVKAADDGKTSQKKYVYDPTDDKLNYLLGLHDLHDSNDWRTASFNNVDINKIQGDSDKTWHAIMDHCKQVLNNKKGMGLDID